jgi:hypothetical protein
MAAQIVKQPKPMRTLYHISVNRADIEPSRLRELLDKAEVEAEKITKPGTLGVYAATIADDMLGAERLRDLLRRNGVDSFMRQSRVQSDDEILAAPLAVVRIDRAPSGEGGPRYGTEFDLDDACPRCGTGARPVGDIVLRASDVPKSGDVFETLDGERFVSDRVRDAMIDSEVTGAEFHPVRAARTGDRLPWSGLVAPFELPPFDRETTGGVVREDPCPVCDRDGYFGTARSPLELRYSFDGDFLSRTPDLASTWERFGRSKLAEPLEESVFAQPLLLVKPNVVELLRKLKVRSLKFDPVGLVS